MKQTPGLLSIRKYWKHDLHDRYRANWKYYHICWQKIISTSKLLSVIMFNYSKIKPKSTLGLVKIKKLWNFIVNHMFDLLSLSYLLDYFMVILLLVIVRSSMSKSYPEA